MGRQRILDLLEMLAESARGDRAAGRLIWADLQDELVKLVREYMRERRLKSKKSETPWRTPKPHKNSDA